MTLQQPLPWRMEAVKQLFQQTILESKVGGNAQNLYNKQRAETSQKLLTAYLLWLFNKQRWTGINKGG